MKRISKPQSCRLSAKIVFCLLVLIGFGTDKCMSQDDTRTWVDASGKYEIEASFGGMEDNQVVLHKSDGSTIKLPIDKLSDADQQWVIQTGMNADPLAGAPDPEPKQDNNSPQNKPSPGKRGTVEADTSDAVEIGNKSVSDWSLNPDAAVPPPAPATEIDISMPDSGPLVGTQAAISRSGDLAVFSNDQNILNKYTVVNLTTGVVLGTVEMESYSAPQVHAVSPDGMNMICESRAWGEFNGINVKIVELRNGKPQERINWECHAEKDAKALHYCQFVDDEHLITCNKAGTIALWDFRFAKLVWWFNSEGPVKPAISANGKYLVTMRNDRLIVIDTAAGAIVATKAIEAEGLLGLAISPDGTKIAGAGNGRARVWDFRTGTELLDSESPCTRVARMYWPDNRYFVVDYLAKSLAFDSQLQVPVSHFKWDLRSDFLIDSNCNVWYWNPQEGKKMHLLPMIPPVTQKKLEGKTAADFIVLPAGGSVRVEYNFQNFRREIEDSIRRDTERALTEAGFKVSSSANIVMRVFAGIGDKFQDEDGRTGRKIDFAIPRFRHSKTQFFAMALYDEDGKPVWYGPDSETGEESADNGNYFKYLRLVSNLRRIDHLSVTAKPLDDMTGSDSPFGGGRDRSGGFGSGGFGGRGGPPGFPGSFDKDDKDGDDGGDH